DGGTGNGEPRARRATLRLRTGGPGTPRPKSGLAAAPSSTGRVRNPDKGDSGGALNHSLSGASVWITNGRVTAVCKLRPIDSQLEAMRSRFWWTQAKRRRR